MHGVMEATVHGGWHGQHVEELQASTPTTQMASTRAMQQTMRRGAEHALCAIGVEEA